MNIDNQKLAEALKGASIGADEIAKLLEEASSRNISLYELVSEKHILPEDEFGKVVAKAIGFPYINLSNVDINSEVLELIPENIALKQGVVTFEIDDKSGRIQIASSNPLDLEMINDIKKKTGREADVFYTTKQGIKNIIGKYNQELKHVFLSLLPSSLRQTDGGKDVELKKGEALEEEVPIIKIFETILVHAYRQHASDIHIEASRNYTVVRYRIDGVLHQVVAFPKVIHEALVTRCKILAGLRIDETRAAQDGRIAMTLDGDPIAFRVSILPTNFGEKIVMRLLVDIQESVSLQKSGLSDEDYKKVINNSSKPYGMLLVTGPTGSGKTTTLYSVIKLLNSKEINISTIEDPIEYGIEGINQVQVNHATDLTFANGLRALLRQDPDNILVGEIRDKDTAQIAIESAMTGHMVFSTLHANSAAIGIPRLVEMGIEPFLLTAALNCLIAQRLVRKLCNRCLESRVMNEETLNMIYQEKNVGEMVQKVVNEFMGNETSIDSKDEFVFYRATGCKACGFTGYKGRVGIYEVLELNPELKKAIIEGKSAQDIEAIAVKTGMKTMLEDGIRKALSGTTSLEEIIRVIKT